jgi:hypothetical protein
VRIVLTRKGRRLAEEIMPLHAQDIQSSLAFMPAEQLEMLNQLLAALRDGLRNHSPGGRPARRTKRARPRTRSRTAKPSAKR